MYRASMDTAILVLIAACFGGGTVGGLVIALGWEKRTYATRTRVDAVEVSLELLKSQLLAEIKRRAGKEGLDQRARNKEIEELARNLPAEKKVQELPPAWWEMNEKVNHG
jgi:hypothetical protein